MRVFALIAASALAGILFGGGPARATGLEPLACAAGYHVDRGGNCQPDIAQENRWCPRGTVFHPTFDGWTCDPPPPEAY
jgi:hypothetical protein